jgi:hypothetical protein
MARPLVFCRVQECGDKGEIETADADEKYVVVIREAVSVGTSSCFAI